MQLGDRPFVVVDAKIDDDIGEARIAGVLLDDQERRRLLAAPVAAGSLRGRQALEQPLGQREVAVALERRRERVDRAAETRMLPWAA